MADTPLDNLYRDRTSAGLKDSLPGDCQVDEATDDGQTVRVEVTWSRHDSYMRLDCTRGEVNFLSLTSSRKGLYSDLVEKLPRFFKLRGVQAFVMYPRSEESRDVLLKRGNWTEDVGRYRWEL